MAGRREGRGKTRVDGDESRTKIPTWSRDAREGLRQAVRQRGLFFSLCCTHALAACLSSGDGNTVKQVPSPTAPAGGRRPFPFVRGTDRCAGFMRNSCNPSGLRQAGLRASASGRYMIFVLPLSTREQGFAAGRERKKGTQYVCLLHRRPPACRVASLRPLGLRERRPRGNTFVPGQVEESGMRSRSAETKTNKEHCSVAFFFGSDISIEPIPGARWLGKLNTRVVCTYSAFLGFNKYHRTEKL